MFYDTMPIEKLISAYDQFKVMQEWMTEKDASKVHDLTSSSPYLLSELSAHFSEYCLQNCNPA